VGEAVMLPFSQLRDIPDETANRMMMVNGSAQLLRAIHGEPEPLERTPTRSPSRRGYTPVSDRLPMAVPSSVRIIIEQVAEVFEVHPEEMRGQNKARELVLARAVAIRIIRERTWETGEPKHSLPTIGRYFRRDHSTIAHALAHFDEYSRVHPEIQEVYESLRGGQ